MGSISTIVIKNLYAKSGNRCAFPGCTEKLTYTDYNISEIAHIISEKANGPRHDPSYNKGNYNVDENLILLCCNHHKLVDSNEEEYTVDVLRHMKYSHEAYNESLIGMKDINHKVINQFLTLIHQFRVSDIIKMNDFLTPINFNLLEKLDYCSMEINKITNSIDIISCNSQLVQDINRYKETLCNLTFYLSDKGHVDGNFNFIPFYEIIDKLYVLELRTDLNDIYQKYMYFSQ